MADQNAHHELTEEIHIDSHANEHESGLFSADGTMVLLTWITFFTLLGILHKFAWKPILTLLKKREESIQTAVDHVEKIKIEMESLDSKCQGILNEAEERATQILTQARQGAVDAAKIIEHKAKEEARITLENALRDIHEERDKAKAFLQKESTKLAIDLASKLLEENLDDEKNRTLVNNLIKQI